MSKEELINKYEKVKENLIKCIEAEREDLKHCVSFEDIIHLNIIMKSNCEQLEWIDDFIKDLKGMQNNKKPSQTTKDDARHYNNGRPRVIFRIL